MLAESVAIRLNLFLFGSCDDCIAVYFSSGEILLMLALDMLLADPSAL
jgi:hypothetical protein